MLELARDVCGFAEARQAESSFAGAGALITELPCSLVGHEGAIDLAPGSRIERLLGTARTVERYHCAYGVSPASIDLLAAHGMLYSGHDDSGGVRVAELPEHPFFLATLFQPELHPDGVHPVIRGFAQAVLSARDAQPASR
jgi:CTP synthase (UTP-ammonia lyase)